MPGGLDPNMTLGVLAGFGFPGVVAGYYMVKDFLQSKDRIAADLAMARALERLSTKLGIE